MQSLAWLLWAARGAPPRHRGRRPLAAFVLLVNACIALEILDFPPLWNVSAAGLAWHACTGLCLLVGELRDAMAACAAAWVASMRGGRASFDQCDGQEHDILAPRPLSRFSLHHVRARGLERSRDAHLGGAAIAHFVAALHDDGSASADGAAVPSRPLPQVFDAHSLWHLATAALTPLWYRFATADLTDWAGGGEAAAAARKGQ